MKIIQYYEHTCACGCGQRIEVKKQHKWKGRIIPKYVKGHNSKIFPNMLNKNHTEEAKNKNSEKHKGKLVWNKGLTKETSEAVKKISESKIGNKNPMYDKKVQHSEESKQLMSKKAVLNIIKNGDKNFRGKKGHFYSNKNKDIVFYASSYEKKAIEIFENMKSIIYYERCKFYIPYYIIDGSGFFGNKKRRYVPDFIVYYQNREKEIIEIKPQKFIGTQENLSKFLFLENFCNTNGYKFDIWTEKDLQIIRR